MFLDYDIGQLARHGFPRVSGDVPEVTARSGFENAFSPRERGMFPRITPEITPATCFPRVSGDVPDRLA